MSNKKECHDTSASKEIQERTICWLPLKETGVITDDRGYVFHETDTEGLSFPPLIKPKRDQRSVAIHALPISGFLCIREDILVQLLSNTSIDIPCESFNQLCGRFFEGIFEFKIGVFPLHTSFIDEMRVGNDSDLLDNIAPLYFTGNTSSSGKNLYNLRVLKEFMRLFEILSQAKVGDSFEMKMSNLKAVVNNYITTHTGEVVRSTSGFIASGKAFNLTSIDHNNNQFNVTVVPA